MATTTVVSTIIPDFIATHPEDIGSDGILKVCIGGGSGFIGSHIAKRLMNEVIYNYLCDTSPNWFLLLYHLFRDAMLFVLIGKIMSLWSQLNFAMNFTKLILEYLKIALV